MVAALVVLTVEIADVVGPTGVNIGNNERFANGVINVPVTVSIPVGVDLTSRLPCGTKKQHNGSMAPGYY